MNDKRKRKLKRLRKKQIWTQVVLMACSVAAVIAIAFVIIHVNITILIANKAGDRDDYSKYMSKIINNNMKDTVGGDISQIVANIQKYNDRASDICIIDKSGELVSKYGSTLPNFNSKAVIQFGEEYELYTDATYRINYDAEDNSIKPDYYRMIVSTLSFNGKSFKDSEWLNKTVASLTYWLEEPISENGYTVLVKNTIEVKRREMLYVVGASALAFVGLMIPLVIMFVSTIHSVITQKRMRNLMYTDLVTGGRNWEYFKAQSIKLMSRRKNLDTKYAFVDVKLDKYRSYCSFYGAVKGEELLGEIGEQLSRCITKDEVSAHYAKSNFVLLLIYDDNTVNRLKEIINTLGKDDNGHMIAFTAGVYVQEGGRTAKDTKQIDFGNLYNWASIARNCLTGKKIENVAIYDKVMIENQKWEGFVENSMEQAMVNKEFAVYYQPKYSTVNDELSGAEALVRWISPVKGIIPPGKFIPIFEKNGFIVKLDDYMLDAVAAKQAEWLSAGQRIVPVSVNLSRVHFSMTNLAEHVCSIVDVYKVPHNMIELELTESAFFDDKETLLKTVNQLKEYGFAVSMDDFGSGYSSLNSLKDLPLDVVKLDAEFFRGDDKDKRGEIVIEKAIQLAKSLDMEIVAEGIETKDQVDFLKTHGCDLIQGYYYAKPMPVSEFETEAFKV